MKTAFHKFSVAQKGGEQRKFNEGYKLVYHLQIEDLSHAGSLVFQASELQIVTHRKECHALESRIASRLAF